MQVEISLDIQAYILKLPSVFVDICMYYPNQRA